TLSTESPELASILRKQCPAGVFSFMVTEYAVLLKTGGWLSTRETALVEHRQPSTHTDILNVDHYDCQTGERSLMGVFGLNQQRELFTLIEVNQRAFALGKLDLAVLRIDGEELVLVASHNRVGDRIVFQVLVDRRCLGDHLVGLVPLQNGSIV